MMHRKRYFGRSGIKIFMAAIVGGLLSSFATAARSQDIFGNTGLQFDVDTVIEFEFIESNGAFQSSFGVINLDTGQKTPLLVETKPSDTPQNAERPSDFQDDGGSGVRKDFKGTPGNTVPQPLAEFPFKANTRYAFYLESTYNGRPAGILYSTDVQNRNNNQQVLFDGGLPGLASGGSAIRWDDTGIIKTLQERDFDDFIIRAGGHLDCPYKNNNPSNTPTSQEGSTELGQGSSQSPQLQSKAYCLSPG